MQISSLHENEVSYRSTFCEGTSAQGVFCIFLYLTDDFVDFLKSQFYILSKENARNGTILSENITNGTYYVLSYDIESNGEIQKKGIPAHSTKLTINGSYIGMFVYCQ